MTRAVATRFEMIRLNALHNKAGKILNFRPFEIVSDKRTNAFALFAAIFTPFHHMTVGGTTGGLIGSYMFSYLAPRSSFGAPKNGLVKTGPTVLVATTLSDWVTS